MKIARMVLTVGAMKKMSLCSAALAGLMLLASGTSVLAAFVDGQCPYTDLTGTGTTSDSITPSGPASVSWHNKSDDAGGGGSVYWQYSANSNAPLYYQETWGNTQKTIGTVIIDTSTRNFGGTIYAQTTPNGAYNTVIGSFTPSKVGVFIVNPTQTTMYGIKVELNTTTDPQWYQAGEVSLYQETFTNVAKNQTSVFSGSPVWTGSLTDESFTAGSSEFRSSGTNLQTGTWAGSAGFEFTDQQAHAVEALRYTGGVPHAANYYVWRNPTVEIKQNNVWTSIGAVSMTNTSENVRWIDFGSPLLVQGVRFSSTNAGDVMIDDIQAFEGPSIPVPEPATMALLGLSMLGLALRRR